MLDVSKAIQQSEIPVKIIKCRVFGLSGPQPPVLISGPRPLAPGPPAPVTVIMVYGLMGYLTHVDLPMPHVHDLKKQPYCLCPLKLSCEF